MWLHEVFAKDGNAETVSRYFPGKHLMRVQATTFLHMVGPEALNTFTRQNTNNKSNADRKV